MSAGTIRAKIRDRVAIQAAHRCGYCQTQEAVVGMPLQIEHLIPLAAGGRTTEDNLWLACPRCNLHKGIRTHARDPETGQLVPLFDPRRQHWADHFSWEQRGLMIVGLTPIGRATVVALQMNNDYVVHARQVWIACGWHPPQQSKEE